MLRIVLLGWPCITSSAWILLWIYLQTSNAFKPILLLYVLQPTVVDKQQIQEKRDRRRRPPRDFVGLLCGFCESVAFLLTAEQHCVTDCLPSLNLRWMHHLPNCRNAVCFVALLRSCSCSCPSCYLVGFLERELRKWDIHKTDNPPTFPFLLLNIRRNKAQSGERQ